MITKETRDHLMAARDDVYRRGDGHPNVDLVLVATYIDRALQGLCPHLPATRTTSTDEFGRTSTACFACGMFWYDHDNDPPPVPYHIAEQNAGYMVLLRKRLDARRAKHGFAYVTPDEAERLEAGGLYQPGHTVHRFSTEAEDRSDAVLEERERLQELREAERAMEGKRSGETGLDLRASTERGGWAAGKYGR